MKKISLTILYGVMGFSVLIQPLPVAAIWGIGDTSFDPIQDQSGISTQVAQITQVVGLVQNLLKTFGLDVVIYKSAQKMSQKLIAKVLNKTNGGSDSSSLFVENFGQYFEDITRKEIDQYTNSLQQSNSPFARSIALGIDNQVSGFSNSGGLNAFSLNKYVPSGARWEDAATDISVAGSRGWDFYGQLAMPQNSPLGAGIIAQEELSKSITAARSFGKLELTSDGFLPMKEQQKALNDFSKGVGGSENFWSNFSKKSKTTECTGVPCVNNSGNTEEVPAFVGPPENPNNYTSPESPTLGQSAGMDWSSGNFSGGGGGPTAPGVENQVTVDSGQAESLPNVTTDQKINSPAETTKTNAGQANIEAFSRLRDADTFGKIIFGTISQMISGLIQKGIKNLESDGGSSPKTYGGPQNLANLLNANTKNSWMRASEQIVDLRNQLENAIIKIELEIKFMEETIELTKKAVSNPKPEPGDSERVVLDLEICVPGPDTGWEQRFADYQETSTKETQNAATGSDDKGAKRNSSALSLIRQLSRQSVIETNSLMNNTFLNIPGTSEMKNSLREFYGLSKNFQTTFDLIIVKKQTLTNLQTIAGQVQANAEDALIQLDDPNKPQTLILFSSQWDKLTGLQKLDLYLKISPSLATDFPEYLDATATTANQLKPLPKDDLATADINEPMEEMKKRVLDHQWGVWEQLVSEENKSSSYAKFVAMSRDISDSSSVLRAQNIRDGALMLYSDLQKTLRDCKKIRDYVITDNATNDKSMRDFREQLESKKLRDVFMNPSILTVGNAGFGDDYFSKLNERILNQEVEYELVGFENFSDSAQYGPLIKSLDTANNLQIKNLAINASDLIKQDSRGDLFCRLTLYHLFFWIPKQTGTNSLEGKPMGCSKQIPPAIEGVIDQNGRKSKNGTYLIEGSPVLGERSGIYKTVDANWYHTNNAEIFFSISDQ